MTDWDDDEDAASAAWAHQQELEARQVHEGYVRHELARAAELAAQTGRCPEKATDIERGLLEVAGLNRFDLAA